MRVLAVVLLLICLSSAGVSAAVPPLPASPDPALACRGAAAAAERTHAIPPGLLWAIARAESGRWDPRRRARVAWPWTINAEGEGHFFPSKAAAIAAVRSLQASGVRSIDVGCMQVNLHHHPHAFADLDEAFDPVANATYAGQFLASLRGLTGSWAGAAGRYHSATPERGGPYRERVLALWTGEQQAPWPDGAVVPDDPLASTADPARTADFAPAAEQRAPAPRAGRLLLAPIDHARMARILRARRSEMREAVAGTPGGALGPGSPLPGAPLAGPSLVRPVTTAGSPLRTASAEIAFAERRADALRQWRMGSQPTAASGRTPTTAASGRTLTAAAGGRVITSAGRTRAPTLLRGSAGPQTTLALR